MADREQVAIFWDFENCCPPSTQGLGYDIANNIGRIARVFGCVTTFKAYLDISTQPSRSTALRSELQLSGVSVVDCPHNGKKDVVDKMAIVDMFAFAVDHPSPATVILIAADRDYAYALSTLRLRNYRVVLITPCATSCLEACASFVIDWNVALTKTRLESNTDSVRRPYVDIEASLFNRLAREVSQFGDNVSVVSAPPEETKLRGISAQDLIRSSFVDNDASVASESKFTQASSEGMDQCTNGDDGSSVSITSASKVPAPPHRSSMSLPSPLRTRSASIQSEAVSKPGSGSSRPATASLLPPPDARLKVSDDVDTIIKHSDTFVPNDGENQQSSKDEPHSSIPTSSSGVKAPPPGPTGFDYSSKPHSVPLLNPRLNVSSTPSTSSGTRTISGGTMVALSDTSPLVDIPTPQIEQVATPLTRSSSPIPAVGADPATAHCLSKGDHPPVDVLTAGRSSSPLCRSSLRSSHSDIGRDVPPVSANGDSTNVPTGQNSTSSQSSVPAPKQTNLSVERQSRPASSAESVPKESPGRDNLPSVSPPNLHATPSAVPGSPAAQTPTLPPSGVATTTTTEQANCTEIRRQFLPLIQLLTVDRRRGIFRSSRSDIANALMQVDKNMYKRVGATTFKQYSTLAQRVGLVMLGGAEGDAWIALHPNWSSEGGTTEFQSNMGIGGSRAVHEIRISHPKKFVAGCFQPLVNILVQFHRSGVRPVLRSEVRPMLDPTVYQNAGVTCFKRYIARAAQAGVVLRGGEDDYAWVRLHPDVEMQVNDTHHTSLGASSGC